VATPRAERLSHWIREKPEKRPSRLSAIKSEELHDAFIALSRTAADTTVDPDLASVVRFYDRPDQVDSARKNLAARKPAPDNMICLYANGALVSNPASRDYWRNH
jgi:hypothetical protein